MRAHCISSLIVAACEDAILHRETDPAARDRVTEVICSFL